MTPPAESLLIRDPAGSREYQESDFPLRIGSSENADIQLPGLASGQTLAFLGMENGELFVQPAGSGAPVLLNEKPTTESTWLRDGDILRVENVRLHLEISANRRALRIESAAPQAEEPEPVVTPPPRPAATIDAVVFEPDSGEQPTPAKRVRPLTLAVWGAFIALSLLVAFLFAARSVRIVVEPLPDEMAVSGFPSIELGGRYLLLSGKHRVRASKPEYRELDIEIDISSEQNQEIVLALERLPGILEIDTPEISGAEVLVDTQLQAITPAEIEIPEGIHEIGIQKDRYLPYTTEIEIRGGGHRQNLSVELVPGWADITIPSEPSGARILVDETPVGVTPGPVEIMAGSHELQLQMPGRKAWRSYIEVRANQQRTLETATLELAGATVVLTSRPEGAEVLVDGTYRGQTPLTLDLEPNLPQNIRVSKAGYRPKTEQVELESGATAEVALTLSPRLGEVRVQSQPEDAKLWIDGRERGSANQSLRLSARPHALEIRRPGYEPYRTRIRPEPGFPLAIAVTLIEAGTEPSAPERGNTTPQGQELVKVMPGTFTMGSSRREQGRRANEVMRSVQLTRPFFITAREVTNQDFEAFDPSHESGSAHGEDLDAPNLPVVNVTWEQAAAYCNWLSGLESLTPVYEKQGDTFVAKQPVPDGYRLPTEAEWEWAARYADGQAAQKYPWGMSLPPTPRSGNYADTASRGMTPSHLPGYLDGFAISAPVGSFAPNERGIYDLGGNVAEWNHDIYSIAPGAVGSTEVDPTGPESGLHHVVRGSSWRDASITRLRLSFRDYANTGRPDLGFRVARYADETN